jgi:hypothetical protein
MQLNRRIWNRDLNHLQSEAALGWLRNGRAAAFSPKHHQPIGFKRARNLVVSQFEI